MIGFTNGNVPHQIQKIKAFGKLAPELPIPNLSKEPEIFIGLKPLTLFLQDEKFRGVLLTILGCRKVFAIFVAPPGKSGVPSS